MMVLNTGISFNLLSGIPWWVSLIILIGLGAYAVKMRELLGRVGIGLIIIGGSGNMVQRYLYGGVVDNLNFFNILQNNVWDYFIVGGLCIYGYQVVCRKL